jgi:integrase
VKIFKRRNSKHWWFDFTVRGKRYRGSTKEVNQARAAKIAALKLSGAMSGHDPLDRKSPTLKELAVRFLNWLETARLEADTRRYYHNGWRLLESTALLGRRINTLTTDEVEALRFPGSASNGNNALRTLRRMLHKAQEWKLVFEVPRFKLFKEEGRSLRLDDESEKRLLEVAEQPLMDIVVLMRDTGMRNARELYRMRIENIDWNHRVIFNPDSKTDKGRRFIVMSNRVVDILLVRCAGRSHGWVFPSKRKGKHVTGGLVNKQWVAARKRAGLPQELVLYCARHDFGTYVLQRTGNLKLVMDSMGHADVPTALKYQHPELELVREALNSRHILRHTAESAH